MLTHRKIWNALDALAQHYNLSPSALARKAGLDPTTFNKSKRITSSGRLRWPNTESLSKALEATGASLDDFMAIVNRIDGVSAARPSRLLPLIGFAQAGNGGYFDDGGFPVGGGWDEVSFPDVQDENAYALEVSGDSMLPVFRDGDTIIVSPGSNVRRGDRIVVRTLEGEVLVKVLFRQTAHTTEIMSFNPDYENRILQNTEIDWIARILWASQ
jgi:phage repressor protein C with HTH and peptisase S24 domain